MDPRRSPAPPADWGPVIEAIAASSRIALTTHVRPDTDGIGSAIALHHHLQRAGHDVRIVCPDALPPRLAFLDPHGAVQPYRDGKDAGFVREATVIVLDVSERERLGPLSPLLEGHGGTSICIDHHINDSRRFASINVIEPRASSTGILAHALLVAMGAEIDAVIASAVYATILADTGSFRFSNTTAEVMRIAADLIDRGANPQRIHKQVLGAYSRPKVQLLARALGGAGLECGGQLTWFGISRALFEEVGAREEDCEGLVEYLRLVDGVRVAVLLLEMRSGGVKVSFRSEPGIDVNRLACEWGGGGHRHAAGAQIPGTLAEVVPRVVDRARTLLFPASS